MSARRQDGGLRHFGVYPAIVERVVDPDGLGRVEVSFPWLPDGAEARAWATLLSPYADGEQGMQFVPEPSSQVVVAFEAGDLRRPYVIGAAWNGQAAMPAPPDQANDIRTVKTRSGHVLEFDDKPKGSGKVTLRTTSGHKLVMDDAGDVELSCKAGGKVVLDAAGNVAITGTTTIDLTAPTLNVHAGTANFDGIINFTSGNASASVASPSYTPAAGNVW